MNVDKKNSGKNPKNSKNTKYYITTPIYYANGLPHIGHFLTTTVADAIARYQRKKLGDKNVFFTTGLDAHGTTVEQSALKEGYTLQNIQQYIDKRAQQWKQAFDQTNISYDYFVNTTHPQHKKFAQDFIQKLVDNGDVYKGLYKGKYCTGCEKFLTLSDLDENGFCPLHRRDQVIEIEEENYYFRLSKYAPQVKNFLSSNALQVLPETKRNEMIARIDQGVEDLSISRPKEKVAWGIDFPGDSTQTVYVWVEALLNYLSSLAINKTAEEAEHFWQNSYLTLGKDINWFHNLIWPAFLLATEHPLNKGAFVHSFINISGQKMSKSLGNLITPNELLQKYGADGARYVTLANLPYKNDLDITWNLLDEKYNADLANGLGNLCARLTKLAQNSQLEFEPQPIPSTIWDADWAQPLTEFRVDEALQNIWAKISNLDKQINETQPWALTDQTELKKVLEPQINDLRKLALILEPFIPQTAQKLQKGLASAKITKIESLFPRL